MIEFIMNIIEREGWIMNIFLISIGTAILSVNSAILLTNLKIYKYCKEISKK